MARTDAVSIELAKRRYSEALAAYTLEQWRSVAQDLGLSSSNPTTLDSQAHDHSALDSSDDSGSDANAHLKPPTGRAGASLRNGNENANVNGIVNGAVNGAGVKEKRGNANRQETTRDIARGLQNVMLSPGAGTGPGVSLAT